MNIITIDLDTLREMHEGWKRKGVALALPVKKLQDELAGKMGLGPSFTSQEVAQMLTAISGMYKAAGAEQVLEQLVKDLEAPSLPGATSLQPEERAPPSPSRGGRAPWRIG